MGAFRIYYYYLEFIMPTVFPQRSVRKFLLRQSPKEYRDVEEFALIMVEATTMINRIDALPFISMNCLCLCTSVAFFYYR